MKNGKLWTGFSDWPYQRERTHTTQSLSMNRICSFWVLFAKIYALIHTTTHNRRLTANKIRLKFFHVFLFVRISFNCSPTRIEISICCFALRQQNVSEWIHFAFFFSFICLSFDMYRTHSTRHSYAMVSAGRSSYQVTIELEMFNVTFAPTYNTNTKPNNDWSKQSCGELCRNDPKGKFMPVKRFIYLFCFICGTRIFCLFLHWILETRQWTVNTLCGNLLFFSFVFLSLFYLIIVLVLSRLPFSCILWYFYSENVKIEHNDGVAASAVASILYFIENRFVFYP